VVKEISDRWKDLPMRLKRIEVHSPSGMKRALLRSTYYLATLEKVGLEWIGLQFSPPLLLSIPDSDWNEDTDRDTLKEIEQRKGYHQQGAITKFLPWNVRTQEGDSS